jgi:3',5'-cyclic AMP phosphodiesterase CpdA
MRINHQKDMGHMPQPVRILHLSDLHFGRIEPLVLKELESFIKAHRESINLVILTGDLTQRAKSHEFKQAKEFIDSLNCPFFLVPGNHDVPLYNIFLRFFSPYRKFLKFIGPLAENYYENEALAVYGLWSTNHFSIKSGKVFSKDLLKLEEKFNNLPPHKIKIIAAHHPILSGTEKIRGDIKRVIDLHPHLILSGHTHQSEVRPLNEIQPLPLLIASGTSTSNRTREETNSFNLITVNSGTDILVETFARSSKGFELIKKYQTS